MGYLEDRLKRKNGELPPMQFKKDPKPLKKVSEKKKAEIREDKESGDDSLDKFFAEMRPKMTGRCLFCNAKTMKEDDEKFHFSIAHLLPKRSVDKGGFPSVRTNENNWIELCFWGSNCHGNFDQGSITWEFIRDSAEWAIIKEKLIKTLPFVAPEERKNKLYSKLSALLTEGEE